MVLKLKFCICCGKLFAPKKSHQIYCSPECLREGYKIKYYAKKKPRICKECKKSFITSFFHRVYCSTVCAKKNLAMRVKKYYEEHPEEKERQAKYNEEYHKKKRADPNYTKKLDNMSFNRVVKRAGDQGFSPEFARAFASDGLALDACLKKTKIKFEEDKK